MSDLLRQLIAAGVPSTQQFFRGYLENREEPDYFQQQEVPQADPQAASQPQMEYRGPVMLLPAGPPQMGPDGRLYAQRQQGIPLLSQAVPSAGHGFFERKAR
jgi:hypothetical protein